MLFGGETTIKVKWFQEPVDEINTPRFVCRIAAQKVKNGITLLCAGGTDGNDGPTSAAGAVVDSKTIGNALSMEMNIQKYLNNFDSFHFFEKAGGHIITGPTMTNVMDLIIVIIE